MSVCFHLIFLSLGYSYIFFWLNWVLVWDSRTDTYWLGILHTCAESCNKQPWFTPHKYKRPHFLILSLPLFSAFHLVAQQKHIVNNIRPHVSSSTLSQKGCRHSESLMCCFFSEKCPLYLSVDFFFVTKQVNSFYECDFLSKVILLSTKH